MTHSASPKYDDICVAIVRILYRIVYHILCECMYVYYDRLIFLLFTYTYTHYCDTHNTLIFQYKRLFDSSSKKRKEEREKKRARCNAHQIPHTRRNLMMRYSNHLMAYSIDVVSCPGRFYFY